ncbi:unnamed protein product [Schistosoma curassoni]|uniref:Coiled-coil domain-containing protein 52 n=1 Tax=Schistosoma curassoni TaxID=6186 RepID=A0A183L712_9TREM|nr:unnamed protein product [Schistosoma curassoni]
MLDDSVSNLIVSSTSRSKSIDNIKSELNTVFKQLTDMRSKVESLASSVSKHDDLKQEIKTLSPLKLLLSKNITELDDIIKAESVIDFIANDVTKRIISLSDKTTNQRLTQKRTLNVNKGVEITKNQDASAAGFTDAATLSHVLQYSDIPTKNANLPVMSVVTSDSQCTSNDVINPILPSLPLEAHKQVRSSNATTLKNAVEIKIPLPRKKNVSTEPSGSRPSIKNTTMTVTNKNKAVLPDTMLYLTHRSRCYSGRHGSNLSQMATAIIM